MSVAGLGANIIHFFEGIICLRHDLDDHNVLRINMEASNSSSPPGSNMMTTLRLIVEAWIKVDIWFFLKPRRNVNNDDGQYYKVNGYQPSYDLL